MFSSKLSSDNDGSVSVLIVLLVWIIGISFLVGIIATGIENKNINYNVDISGVHVENGTINSLLYNGKLSDLGINVLKGTWIINNNDGLKCVDIAKSSNSPINIGINSKYASVKFGKAEYSDYSKNESFYIKNYNNNQSDSFGIYVCNRITHFWGKSEEYYLMLSNNRIYIYNMNYLNTNSDSRFFYLFNYIIPSNLHDFKISYSYDVNSTNFKIYIDDTLVEMKNIDLKSYGSLFGLIGEDKFSCDNIEHKLFTTNIGLSISNSYEKISINTNQNLDFWSMTALAMIFVVPDIYVPYALQVLFIKVPEIALAYIIFRLIRGGG